MPRHAHAVLLACKHLLKQAVLCCCSTCQSHLHINDVLCIVADALRAAAMHPPLLLLDHPMRPPQLVLPHHVIGGCARTAGRCVSLNKWCTMKAATRQASARHTLLACRQHVRKKRPCSSGDFLSSALDTLPLERPGHSSP